VQRLVHVAVRFAGPIVSLPPYQFARDMLVTKLVTNNDYCIDNNHRCVRGAPGETRTPGLLVHGYAVQNSKCHYGLGFELASEKSAVGRNGPKIENVVALEMDATA
jgi:hypothetical protein